MTTRRLNITEELFNKFPPGRRQAWRLMGYHSGHSGDGWQVTRADIGRTLVDDGVRLLFRSDKPSPPPAPVPVEVDESRMLTTKWREFKLNDGTPLRMRVDFGMTSYAKQPEHFAIRGNVERFESGRWITEGSNLRPIPVVFPELQQMMKWHGWSQTEGPIHYVANAKYFIEECDWTNFKRHVNLGVDPDFMPRIDEDIESWCMARLPNVLEIMKDDLTINMEQLDVMEDEPTGDEELAKEIGVYIFESTPLDEGKHRVVLCRENQRPLVVPEFTCRQKFKAWDVVECLISDAQGGQMSHKDFCENYGGSVDSIKDRKVWIACVRMNRKLKTFLGEYYERCVNLS